MVLEELDSYLEKDKFRCIFHILNQDKFQMDQRQCKKHYEVLVEILKISNLGFGEDHSKYDKGKSKHKIVY